MRIVHLLTAFALIAGTRTTLAAPTVTFDEATFLADNPIAFEESFGTSSAFPPQQKMVTFGQVQFTSTGSADPYWTDDGDLFRKFSGGGGSSLDVRIDFENSMFATAIGVALHPFGHPNQFVISIGSRSGLSTTVELVPNAGDTFIGIADPEGIASVLIAQRPEAAQGVSTNFSLASFARSELYIDITTSRPEISGWSVSSQRNGCSVQRAALALHAEATADGKTLAQPDTGYPVTLWNAKGRLEFVAPAAHGALPRLFHGSVVCVANLGPASAFATGGDPDLDLWEVRTQQLTPEGPRYRSFALQDGASADYVGYESPLSSDATCGHPSEIVLTKQTWGDISIQP